MADANPSSWYLKGASDEVFGPIDTPTLLDWAKDSRIEPSFTVSHDRENWRPAPHVKELEMKWLVETGPGTFYGPFNRAVVDGLLSSGTINGETRLYLLSDGSAESEKRRLQDELALANSTIVDLKRQASRQAETTRRSMAFMEAKLAELTDSLRQEGENARTRLAAVQKEAYAGRDRAEASEARAAAAERRAEKAESELAVLRQRFGVAETELADLRSQLESVMKFSEMKAASATVVPEVVTAEKSPSKVSLQSSRRGTTPAGLAALEAAARHELAVAKRHGLGIKDLFGSKK